MWKTIETNFQYYIRTCIWVFFYDCFTKWKPDTQKKSTEDEKFIKKRVERAKEKTIKIKIRRKNAEISSHFPAYQKWINWGMFFFFFCSFPYYIFLILFCFKYTILIIYSKLLVFQVGNGAFISWCGFSQMWFKLQTRNDS